MADDWIWAGGVGWGSGCSGLRRGRRRRGRFGWTSRIGNDAGRIGAGGVRCFRRGGRRRPARRCVRLEKRRKMRSRPPCDAQTSGRQRRDLGRSGLRWVTTADRLRASVVSVSRQLL
jgi:hypothetical protein